VDIFRAAATRLPRSSRDSSFKRHADRKLGCFVFTSVACLRISVCVADGVIKIYHVMSLFGWLCFVSLDRLFFFRRT